MSLPPLARRLRIAGVLIILGLLVEFFSLLRLHPLAFLLFMFLGGGLLVAGVAVFLISLVLMPSAPPES